jgi:N-succinyldiaminopimelate aminotransferase
VAGDAHILKKFLLYRTYHGCAMSPPIHAASTAAWQDETHVIENRRLYREKFAAVTGVLREAIETRMPDAAFYLWLDTLRDDTEFARGLYHRHNVSVLPGRYLSREARGVDPGRNFVRIALVASMDECTDAARRLAAFFRNR